MKLQLFKLEDVAHFVNRVRYALAGLDPSENHDKELMFQWLWEKFKNWNAISSKTELIREAREGSKRRTWAYLWNTICNHLSHTHEDSNYDAIANGLRGRSMMGMIVV